MALSVHMTPLHPSAPLAAMALLGRLAMGQSAVLQGSVRDSHALPVASAAVSLTLDAHVSNTRTDAQGNYRFSALSAGTYTLRADMAGYTAAAFGPFTLAAKETKQVDLTLTPAAAEFFDEPNFIVAGVTDTNNRGGHGSDSVVRSTEALTRAAASLSKETGATAPEKSLREAVGREPANAELHHALGDVDERLGNALEAAREYQRAAELNATETNLFDWGTELLTHRAANQAIEVFAKGNRLYPRSVRMLLGLGTAFFSSGSYDQAARRLFEAADIDPRDPAPYLFLGKVQSTEIANLDGYVDRMARFASLEPDNAQANYYYSVSLWKRWKGADDRQTATQVQSLLLKALRLDPKLADAWLQLGILYSSLADFPKAVAAYRKAIDAGTQMDQAHYRLAQAYQRMGDTLRARKEFDLYEQLSKASAARTERERSEIQQFVFALRDPTPTGPR